MAEQHPDLVVHLGDYLYEDSADGDSPLPIVRRHTGGKCLTPTDYRRRHAQYKTDPDLRAAHAAAPWAVTWDDHEVENNRAGDVPGTKAPGYAARKRAATRAYYEHMPPRRSALRRDGRIRLTRALHWGDLAAFHLLDTGSSATASRATTGCARAATTASTGGGRLRDPPSSAGSADQRRGYVLGRAVPGELRAEFHTVPYITRRDAPASVAAAFTIGDGARSLGGRAG